MRLFRIGYQLRAATPLDGEGSFRYGSRWSSKKVRVAFLSTTSTLAMLEFLAHVKFEDFDVTSPPALIVVTADVPDASIKTLEEIGEALPPDWAGVPAPSSNAAIGDRWIESRVSLGLAVPSVHPPAGADEYNVLINPAHAKFARIRVDVAPFEYDTRLVVARAERAQRAAGTKRARPGRRKR